MNSQSKYNSSKPAIHIYNLIFLVLSYCTASIHNPLECEDKPHESFLYWILYGNLIIYGVAFLFYILLRIGLLDYCTEKCFNAVCVALNTMGFFGGIIIYNLISMVYSLILYFGANSSECLELELFTMFSAYIILIFIICNCFFFVYFMAASFFAKKSNEINKELYQEMEPIKRPGGKK